MDDKDGKEEEGTIEHLFGVYFVARTVLSTLCTSAHLILTTMLLLDGGRFY